MARRNGVYAVGESGVRWRLVITAGADPERPGRYIRYRESFHGDKTAAKKRLARMRTEVLDGTYAQAGPESVSSFLEEHIAKGENDGRLRPRTAHTYRLYLKNWVTSRIGAMKLGDVRPRNIDNVMTAAAEGGLSPTSRLQLYRILSSAFKRAVKLRVIAVNPCDGVDPPKTSKPKLVTPNAEQIGKLLAVCDPDERVLFGVDAAIGFRRGEVLALRWGDVVLDGEHRSATMGDTLQRIPFEGLRRVAPKTESGYRTVPLPMWAVDLLKAWKTDQNKRRLIAGAAWQGDYIFDNGVGGPRDPDGVSHAMKRRREQAALGRVRLHDLRHAFCTELARKNVDPALLSKMAGHASVRFTFDTYVHPDEKATRVVADVMDNALGDILGS